MRVKSISQESGKWFAAIICGSFLLAGLELGAQTTAVTSPIGAYVIKILGKSEGETQKRTYFGVQLLPERKFQGLAAQVSGREISASNVGNHAQLATTGRRSYVHVLTGAGRGFISEIEEFRTANVRCAQDLTGWITPGTQFSIRPYWSVADLFGATNKFNLAAGTEASTGDNLALWNPETQAETVYYFHSGRNRWEAEGIAADASDAPVRFPYGAYLIRRSAGTLRVALSGDVASEPVLLPVRTGANVFSLPVNLGASLDVLATAGERAVIAGQNAREADLLVFEEPTTGVRRGPFYRSLRVNAAGWREAGVSGSGAGATSLDLLSTLILNRQGAGGYVLAEGNTSSGAGFPALPPEPESGEVPLSIKIPANNFPAGLEVMIETSQDLQNWSAYQTSSAVGGLADCTLPAGQSRGFYRLKLSAPN